MAVLQAAGHAMGPTLSRPSRQGSRIAVSPCCLGRAEGLTEPSLYERGPEQDKEQTEIRKIGHVKTLAGGLGGVLKANACMLE